MNFNNLWVEKYRPKSLSDIVLVEETRSIANSFKDKKEIPNLLLIGIQGIGKTSLAKIIVNDILGCQYLYINASDENGIDTIRNKVVSFSKTKSFDGGIKVIILDEVDGISLEAQKALRNTMEEYSSNTRFILTGNYKHKIIQALQSRCQELNLIPPLEGIAKRVLTILRSENIFKNNLETKRQLLSKNEVRKKKCSSLFRNANFLQIKKLYRMSVQLQFSRSSNRLKTQDCIVLRKYGYGGSFHLF